MKLDIARCDQCAATIWGISHNTAHICSDDCEERYDARLLLGGWYPNKGHYVEYSSVRKARVVQWILDGQEQWVTYCTGFDVYKE